MPDKTTPQIEKAARAICVADGLDPDALNGAAGVMWRLYIDDATAALSTTLEPSEAEIEAAIKAVEECPIEDFERDGPRVFARASLIAAARVRVGE